ncbi:MAG: lipoate--protein ligase [Coriobacteriia bacterium]|nr:lipoate--protein ligase [Coriobacteriia bacterium]
MPSDLLLLTPDTTDPYLNLAREEHLIKHTSPSVLMLWSNSPAIIVGRNQATANQLNRAYVDEHNIAVVRRLSGGGAVYHDAGNLNFTVILRDGAHHNNDFDFFTRPLLELLNEHGVPAEFSGRNDLLVEGKKFSGNAQYRYGTTLLHHGTILWESDLSALADALKPKVRTQARGVDSHEARVTNLAPYLPGLSLARFAEELGETMSSSRAAAVLEHELLTVPAALIEKYRSDRWNWDNIDTNIDTSTGAPIGTNEGQSFPASC